MPLAESRLEVLQVRKLIQCVRLQDSDQIAKLVQLGIPGLINYQGESCFISVKYMGVSECVLWCSTRLFGCAETEESISFHQVGSKWNVFSPLTQKSKQQTVEINSLPILICLSVTNSHHVVLTLCSTWKLLTGANLAVCASGRGTLGDHKVPQCHYLQWGRMQVKGWKCKQHGFMQGIQGKELT